MRDASYTNLSHHQQPETDLAGLLEAIWLSKAKIVFVVLVCVALAFLITQAMPKQYRSTAQILIENQNTPFTLPATNPQSLPQQQADELSVVSQIQIIGSRDLAETVINKLELYKNPEFNKALSSPGLLSSLFVTVGLSPDPLSLTQRDRVYRTFAEKLVVYQINNSRVIAVSFHAEDPELAAQIVETIVSSYIAFTRDTQSDNTRNASSWLEEQISELREKVAESEADVAQFQASRDLLTGLNNASISSQRLTEISTQITRAEAERAEAIARADQLRASLRAGVPLTSIPEVSNSALIQRLQERQVNLRAGIAELSATLLPGHPRLKELNAQLNDLSRQIRSEALRIARSFENEANIAEARAQSLRENQGEIKAEASRVNSAEVELRALEREAKAQRDLLEAYLARYREATGRENAENLPADVQVIQQATLSASPVFPNSSAIILATFIGALVLSVLFVLSLTLMKQGSLPSSKPSGPNSGSNNRRRKQYQPDNSPKPVYPVSDNVRPMQPATRTAVNLYTPSSSYGGQNQAENSAKYGSQSHIQAQPSAPQPLSVIDTRTLRHLSTVLRKSGAHTITLMAVPDALSASDVSASIARAQALEGDDIVLMEACLGAQKSDETSLTRAGFDLRPGLSELLAGQAGFEDVLHQDSLSPLHILPMGKAKTPDLEVLASTHIADIFKALSQTYNRAFVDAGILGEKALAMVARSELCLVVTRPSVPSQALERTRHAAVTLLDSSRVIIVEAPEWIDDTSSSYVA
jgi:succinoglycan biosynthesis transport protein ExoP